MPQPTDLLTLLASGPVPAAALVERLSISRPTLSRLIAAAGSRVIRYGAARATAYAAPRSIAGHANWPIYRIDERGASQRIATLHAVGGGYLAELTEEGRHEFSEALPWWLQDMRPQGFLGRAFARGHALALALPENLGLWNDDHSLIAITALGDDTPGNLLVGDTALAHYLGSAHAPAIALDERVTRYPALAAAALAGEAPGSSAGGEQPKFSAVLDEGLQQRAVLVKFSSAMQNPISQRWASLLVAEHHALQTLHAAGYPASRSELLQANGQTFLQVERFDRLASTDEDSRLGRRGVVSLAALDDAFVGQAAQPWPLITAQLAAQGRITPESHRLAERLFAFGLMIGNTDMHRGNLAFLHTGGILDLAPAYDMLPMHYAPRASGEMNDTPPEIRFRNPPALEAWREMLPLAHQWAASVAADSRIDEALRSAISRQAQSLAGLAGTLLL
ncbi:type II toxin-antitoxin system HipA family toxin YjjJ [Uliginosibacterium sp. 31-16]|uniref:type II toxin-antitoxin system HipA family toxin YjjJ n=1 Tax=Uliginosibacterium sp. 31-16 TaxID=3068315 RepID=UPI00273E2CA4|nr:type II toxin-antitoxin system HipA family toxin YjjJ [Uliginosibacterium sp. 31-16]MDP5239647.1 type II toxin-antitoxin system HipA family toxin YjjJ [Uliginosibacterium sp. 31-16]